MCNAPTYQDWKQAQEYEGRLFFGAYSYSRLRFAERDAPIREMIRVGRERYNALREKFGLMIVTNWAVCPALDQLVQYQPSPEKITTKELT